MILIWVPPLMHHLLVYKIRFAEKLTSNRTTVFNWFKKFERGRLFVDENREIRLITPDDLQRNSI